MSGNEYSPDRDRKVQPVESELPLDYPKKPTERKTSQGHRLPVDDPPLMLPKLSSAEALQRHMAAQLRVEEAVAKAVAEAAQQASLEAPPEAPKAGGRGVDFEAREYPSLGLPFEEEVRKATGATAKHQMGTERAGGGLVVDPPTAEIQKEMVQRHERLAGALPAEARRQQLLEPVVKNDHSHEFQRVRRSGKVPEVVATRGRMAEGDHKNAVKKQNNAERARDRDRRRAWGRKAKLVSEEVAHQLDAMTSQDRVQRRKRVQENTAEKHKEASNASWEKAISHEPRERRQLFGDFPREEVSTAILSSRSMAIDLMPERGYRWVAEQAWKATATRLDHHRPAWRKAEDATAHLVVSWPKGTTPTAGEAIVTARRYLVRLGVDLHEQEVAGWMHHDTDHAHLHIAVGRDRADGGRWCPGIGVDRALALEARLMAAEKGQDWAQRMVARSKLSTAGAVMARQGKMHATVRYPGSEVAKIAWQGVEADARVEADAVCHGIHAGISIAKMVGTRDAYAVSGYCGQ